MMKLPDDEFLRMDDPAGAAFPPQPRSMFLPLRAWPWSRFFMVWGGPWKDGAAVLSRGLKADSRGLGVCLAEDQCKDGAPHPNVLLQVFDFGVPSNPRRVQTALRSIFKAVLNGRPVYVGCGWGRGRTGLILALLAKACGAHDPVQYVRENYLPLAVETKEQEKFVAEFDVGDLPWLLRRKLWRRRLTLGLFKV